MSALNTIKGQMECGVCLQPMRDERGPLVLDCGHLICKSCFRQIGRRVFGTTNWNVRCPECRLEKVYEGEIKEVFQFKNLVSMIHDGFLIEKICNECGDDIHTEHYCGNCFAKKIEEIEQLNTRYVFQNLTPYERYQYELGNSKNAISTIAPRHILLKKGDKMPAHAIMLESEIETQTGEEEMLENMEVENEVVPDSQPPSPVHSTRSVVGPIQVQSSPELVNCAMAGASRGSGGSGDRVFVRLRGPSLAGEIDESVINLSDGD